MMVIMMTMLGNHENEGDDDDVDGDVVEDDIEQWRRSKTTNDGDDKQSWLDDAHDNHDDGDGTEMMVMMNE